MTASPFYMELSFAPSFALVSVVRRSVQTFFTVALERRDLAEHISTAVHELLENAIKFTSDGESSIRVELAGAGRDRKVQVVTRNRAVPEHLDTVRAMFDMMDKEPDPMKFYVGLMERSAGSDQSQLGLGRVRAESGMELSYQVEGDRLAIHARLDAPEEV